MNAHSLIPNDKTVSDVVDNAYTITLLIEAKLSNPNGDPDRDNAPRIDPLSRRGLISDVSIKRKIRDYLAAEYSMPLHVANGAILNDNVTEVTESLGIAVNRVTKAKKTAKPKTKANDDEASDSSEKVKSSLTAEEAAAIRRGMCDKYVDVRLFGAVLGTGNVPAGYCHGPVQVGIAESVSPILTLELAITRCAATNAERAVNDTEMGRKHVVAYGLYRTEIHISGPRAAKTGMTYGDVQNLVHSLKMMWELDRSAARGMMSSRDIIVMRHHSPRCNAPSYVLRDLVSVTRSNGSNNDPATDYSDYTIQIGKMPEGVTLVAS